MTPRTSLPSERVGLSGPCHYPHLASREAMKAGSHGRQPGDCVKRLRHIAAKRRQHCANCCRRFAAQIDVNCKGNHGLRRGLPATAAPRLINEMWVMTRPSGPGRRTINQQHSPEGQHCEAFLLAVFADPACILRHDASGALRLGPS